MTRANNSIVPHQNANGLVLNLHEGKHYHHICTRQAVQGLFMKYDVNQTYHINTDLFIAIKTLNHSRSDICCLPWTITFFVVRFIRFNRSYIPGVARLIDDFYAHIKIIFQSEILDILLIIQCEFLFSNGTFLLNQHFKVFIFIYWYLDWMIFAWLSSKVMFIIN